MVQKQLIYCGYSVKCLINCENGDNNQTVIYKLFEFFIQIMLVFTSSRLIREWKTVEIMISMYCKTHHGTNSFECVDCNLLREYVKFKLENCQFGDQKPTCANCEIHCYRKTYREEIKKVMRFSGPRMIFRHPILSLLHLFDGRKTSQLELKTL